MDHFKLKLLHGHKGSIEDIVRSGIIQNSQRLGPEEVIYHSCLVPGPFFFKFKMVGNEVTEIEEL